METKHKIEWHVEGSDMVHTIPQGAEITVWIEKALEEENDRKVVLRYTSEPYSEENPCLEILLPGGKTVVVNPFECTVSQE